MIRDRQACAGIEAIASTTEGSVTSCEVVPRTQSSITFDELLASDQAVRDDPRLPGGQRRTFPRPNSATDSLLCPFAWVPLWRRPEVF